MPCPYRGTLHTRGGPTARPFFMPKKDSKKTPVKRGDVVETTILNLASGGDGVGQAKGGYTIFVPFAAAGDRLRVRVTQARKTYGRAKIVEVLEAGQGRVNAPCPVAGDCGGCSWQHLDYAAQVAAKGGLLREALKRIGGLGSLEVEPVLGAKETFAYRNRAQVPVRAGADGKCRLGFFAAGSHDLVALPAEGCRIQSAAMNEVLRFLRDRLDADGFTPYDEKKESGLLRHLVLRDNHLGEVMLVLVVRQPLDDLVAEKVSHWIRDCAPLKSVLEHLQAEDNNVVLDGTTRSLAGPAVMEESIASTRFRLSAESFFQVHRGQTPRLWHLVEKARSWSGRETVAELYCGAGTLSMALSPLCRRLLGFENSRPAVEDARANASRNGLSNLEFFDVPAEKAFERLWDMDIQPDVVLMDPPRKGLSPQVLAALLTHQPPSLVYVSCDPASLARDLGQLAAAGYVAEQARPLDLFPQTWHVETVVGLRLEKGGLD